MGAATAVQEVSTEIVLAKAGELLGPGSAYEVRRNELRREFEPIIAAAKTITVVDSVESAEKANEMGRLLQVGVKESEEFFKSVKKQIDNIKAPVLAAEKEDVVALNAEKVRLGGAITTYREKVEAERQAAQRAAEEAAAAQAKLDREEAERQAREDTLNRAIEAGDDAILDEEIVVPEVFTPVPIVQVASPPMMRGSSTRTTYSAGVIGWEEKMLEKPVTHRGWQNLMVLVKAVAEGKAPLRALMPNESFIAKEGANNKEGFLMAGCELRKTKGTSFRG